MRKPPYYKQAAAILASRHPPGGGCIWVCAGSQAWDGAKRLLGETIPRPAVCLPPRDPADRLDWSIVSGRDVLLFYCGAYDETAVDHLAALLIQRGAVLVYAMSDPRGPQPDFCEAYRRYEGEEAA